MVPACTSIVRGAPQAAHCADATWMSFLGFAAPSRSLIVVPGPSVSFVAGRAVALRRRAALVTVVGNAKGDYV